MRKDFPNITDYVILKNVNVFNNQSDIVRKTGLTQDSVRKIINIYLDEGYVRNLTPDKKSYFFELMGKGELLLELMESINRDFNVYK